MQCRGRGAFFVGELDQRHDGDIDGEVKEKIPPIGDRERREVLAGSGVTWNLPVMRGLGAAAIVDGTTSAV